MQTVLESLTSYLHLHHIYTYIVFIRFAIIQRMQFVQKKKTALIISASLLFAITACQPPADKTESSNTTSTSAQTENPPSTQPIKEAKTPKELTTALVDSSAEKLREQLICTKLGDTINAIDNKSKIENIHAVQRQITACLPAANNAEILQWLEDYQAMYRRFLKLDSAMDDEALFTVMSDIEQGKTIAVSQLKQVSPRVRYLIGLVRSRADVNVRYMGEGHFEFHHDLTAMADIFTPYLPDDQNAFIERMANDNQELFWFDTATAFSFEELVERAVFWEDFMTRYPHSHFYNDAKALFNSYAYLLFFGSENTQWLDDNIRKFYIPADERLMTQLTKRIDSDLAQQVQKLWIFMQQSDSERHQSYPVPKKDKDGHKIDDGQVARYQLKQALEIASQWDTVRERNCLNGIICVDEPSQ